MSGQLIRQLKFVSTPLEQVNRILASHGQRLAIGGEGMVGNRVVKEVMNLRRRHNDKLVAIGGALYYCLVKNCGCGVLFER